ncbi:MAG: hypothetical protein HY782_16360 [Chloroflexi bacterium]|nr:hypothetical protein [Chloroflexota bacterium]
MKQTVVGAAAITLNPLQAARSFDAALEQETFAARPGRNRMAFDARRFQALLEQEPKAIPDDQIPTAFFNPGYTQARLEEAWQNGDLANGFPYGLIDTHTLGGMPEQANVHVDPQDGSAVLTVRRLKAAERAEIDAVEWKKALMLEGENNGLDMDLSVAAFWGRLPTDLQSVECTITLPGRIVTGDPAVGMVGVGWTLWTLPDIERLAANLANLGVSPEENAQITARVYSSYLEEDIAEMGIAEPSVAWGDPLLLRIIGGHMLFFMAGRKTPTAKAPVADVMHVLREPLAIDVPPGLTYATIRGWLAQDGTNQDQALKRPLRVRMDLGAQVYDPTRDAMAVPITFRLNDQLLTPTATRDFPGFEDDKGGNTTANLSIWRIRTRQGDWVTIPRNFVIDYGSINRAGWVRGETDSVRFGNVIITRRAAAPHE